MGWVTVKNLNFILVILTEYWYNIGMTLITPNNRQKKENPAKKVLLEENYYTIYVIAHLSAPASPYT
jgi:hypothetical protein